MRHVRLEACQGQDQCTDLLCSGILRHIDAVHACRVVYRTLALAYVRVPLSDYKWKRENADLSNPGLSMLAVVHHSLYGRAAPRVSKRHPHELTTKASTYCTAACCQCNAPNHANDVRFFTSRRQLFCPLVVPSSCQLVPSEVRFRVLLVEVNTCMLERFGAGKGSRHRGNVNRNKNYITGLTAPSPLLC